MPNTTIFLIVKPYKIKCKMIHPDKKSANIAQIENKIKDCCYNNDGHCYLSIIGCMKDTECDAEIEGNKIICSCYTPSKKEV